MDQRRHNDVVRAFMRRMVDTKKKGAADEIDLKTRGMGIFVILSSENIEVSNILPLYYTLNSARFLAPTMHHDKPSLT
jgi:hypothetical protein